MSTINKYRCHQCLNLPAWFSSGTGQHQKGGTGGGADVRHCGDQPPVQTKDPGVCIWWCEGTELDWPYQDAPALWGEVRWGRVPLHWDSKVWRGLDGLCSTLQRLSAVVSGGAAAGNQPLSRGHWLMGVTCSHWRGKLSKVLLGREKTDRLAQWQSLSLFLLPCDSVETKNGAPECFQTARFAGLDSQSRTWCKVECVRTVKDEELSGFKCSRPRLVFMCIKCEWRVYFEDLRAL